MNNLGLKINVGRPWTLSQLWRKWKSLRLPWRKQWLVGSDLQGNTYWEFKDALNANRLRRIVRYSRTIPLADVKLTPAWMQWLRHTRNDAPTHNEQATELIRQAQIKHLAAQADARWKAQASYLEQPKPPAPGLSLTLGAGIPSGQQQGAAVEDLVAKSEESVKLASEEIRSATTARKSKKATRWEDIRLGKNVTEQQPETWVPRPVKRG